MVEVLAVGVLAFLLFWLLILALIEWCMRNYYQALPVKARKAQAEKLASAPMSELIRDGAGTPTGFRTEGGEPLVVDYAQDSRWHENLFGEGR